MVRNLVLPLLVVVCLAGCATRPRPQPLSLAEVISMSKAGLTDAEIIARVDATRTVFRLTSEDVVLLHNEGVSDGVVNYLLDSYTRYEMDRARDYYRSRWDYSIGFGYWYAPHYHHHGRPRHRWH